MHIVLRSLAICFVAKAEFKKFALLITILTVHEGIPGVYLRLGAERRKRLAVVLGEKANDSEESELSDNL